MDGPALFEQVRASPSLVWVAAAICLHIMNVFLGLTMAFQKKTPAMLRVHAVLYVAVLAALLAYLVLNGTHGENSLLDYGVGLYFITIVPLSRKWDVMTHASITVFGLILLPMLILMQII